MKKIVMLLMVVSLALAGCSALGTQQSASSVADNVQQVAKRGCCSHHGGVCGCSGGRTLCCDGTLSPSCKCD